MAVVEKKMAQIKIRRYSPNQNDNPIYDTFEVPIEKGWNVTNVLLYINEHYDGGLAHYLSCRNGSCKGCVVRVNGKPKMACLELVSGDITLDPLSNKHNIKDLLVE